MRSLKIHVLVLALILAGCDSLVQTEPFDQVTSGNFPQNKEDITLGVNGTYDALQGTDKFLLLINQGIPGSIIRNFTNDVPRLQITNQTGEVYQLWTQAYNLIGRANFMLSSIKQNSSLNEDPKITSSIAELRFLRAYSFFNLVRLFGHLPLPTEPPSSLNDVVLPDTTGSNSSNALDGPYYKQVDRSKVYDFIIKDLKYAEENLPESYDASNQGRVTTAAASGMLAKVYLFRAGKKWNYKSGGLEEGNPAYYDSTIIETQKVITSSAGLVDNFDDLFNPDTEHNKENLFSVQYVSSSKAGRPDEGALTLQAFYGIKNSPLTPYSYNIRKAAPTFFNQWIAANSKNDNRFKPTFLTYYVDTNGDTVRWGDNPSTFPGPAVKKYLFDIDYKSGIKAQNSRDYGVNWVILRYADVLLMDSEAKNKSSNYTIAQALDGINKVRDRAGKTNVIAGISQEALNDSIFAERKWELAYEGHYYFDCQRTGRLKEEVENSYKRVGTYADKYYIMPIPFNASQNNPSLIQNKGW